MKNILASLVLFAVSSSAFAIPGYRGRSMSCDQLQQITQRDGEITILHRIGSMTYYASAERCDQFPWRAIAREGYEPSADQKNCFVGWRCDTVNEGRSF
jgi:hypothetical protein